MPSSHSTHQTRTIPEARQELTDIVTAAYDRSEPTIITRGGQPVAAVVSIEDLKTMDAFEDMVDRAVATKRLASFHKRGGTTLEMLRQELGDEPPDEPPDGP